VNPEPKDTVPTDRPEDPYAEKPTLWQKYPEPVQALAAGILTVILTVLSFPPGSTPEFAYAMLVPGIFWAYLRPRLSLYLPTMLGAQAVAWTILLGWLHHVSWVGLLLLGPFIGIWVGSWFLAAWWTMPRMLGRPTPVRLLAMLGLSGAWVVIEWTRTWILTGFPWLTLSASQWQRPSILQIAAYTGAWGISFVLVAVNVGFAAYAHRLFREGERGLRKRSQEFFLALFLLLVCLSTLVSETHNRALYTEPLVRVSLMQPDIPQDAKWDASQAPAILQVLDTLTTAASASHPDLILWPEAVMPLAVVGDPGARDWVERLSRRVDTPLFMGSIAEEAAGDGGTVFRNIALAVQPDTGLQSAYYSKRHLVPFGEYVPLRFLLGWLRKFVPIGDDFTPGTAPSPIVLSAGSHVFSVGPLICYEDVFPGLARDSAAFGADALVVLTNDAWYGEGGAAYQHAAHSVLRAVETRRPVLRVGNAGWSGWIDEFGQIRYVANNRQGSVYFRGTSIVDVSRDIRWVDRETPYVRYGDWFVLASAALAGFGAMLLAAGGRGKGRRRAA